MEFNKNYLVEVNFPTLAVSTNYQFPYIQQLVGKTIRAITAHLDSSVAVSPAGKIVVGTGVGLLVTFDTDSTEDIYLLPYNTLITEQQAGIIREFKPRLINLPNSYITMVSTAGLTADESALFNFFYD